MENCSSNEVVSVNFNQDSTSVAVSTKSFYCLYSLGPDDRIETIHESLSNEAFIIERLFSSSLVAVVTFSSPRRLQVCHFKKGTEICNFSYGSNIVAVKLNRARLVVVLQEALHVHNIRDMKVLHSIKDTPANYSGICALSPDNDNCLLAYPGSANTGEVQVFDAFNLVAKLTIPAHNSPLAALAFNSSGTKLATASGKGTVIRVFNVADGSRLFELRRGVKRFATIYSLAFSSDSRFLAASSNTETVHVFRMDDTKESEKENSDAGSTGWMGYLSKAVSVSASYLPYPVTEVLNQGRSFATAHLPFQGIRNVCALHTVRQQLRLLVASFDGNLYVYAVNPNAGGECNLLVQYRLNETAEGTNGPPESSETVANRPKNSTNESYAGKLKGRPLSSQMTDSEKYREMLAATETPLKTALKLDDEQEFPPMTHRIN